MCTSPPLASNQQGQFTTSRTFKLQSQNRFFIFRRWHSHVFSLSDKNSYPDRDLPVSAVSQMSMSHLWSIMSYTILNPTQRISPLAFVKELWSFFSFSFKILFFLSSKFFSFHHRFIPTSTFSCQISV